MKQFIAAAAAVVLMAVVPAAAQAAGSISGVVTSETTGVTVPGQKVEIYAAPGALVTTTCTGPAGTYVVGGLAAGTYTVRFIDDFARCGTDNRAFAPEWYDGFSRRIKAVPVTVTDGVGTGDISASLRPAAEVSGTVTDAATGAPVANVTVEFLDTEFSVVHSTCTAPDGTYRLRPLPFGVYFVKFIADGRCGPVAAYITQYYDGVPLTASAQFISLVAGQLVPDVNARLIAGVAAELTVSTAGAGTVTSDTGGIACPDRCRAIVARDSTVTLTAMPAAGSTFTGWSGGGCSGTGSCAVAMTGNVAVSATFAPATIPPTGNPGGGTPQPGPGPAGPVMTPARLDTRIVKATINARRGTAKFTLSGSGGVAPLRFDCSLVKKGAKAKFKRCGATVSYKRLKKGAYVFTARVRDARGQVDASPAIRRLSSRRR